MAEPRAFPRLRAASDFEIQLALQDTLDEDFGLLVAGLGEEDRALLWRNMSMKAVAEFKPRVGEFEKRSTPSAREHARMAFAARLAAAESRAASLKDEGD